MKKKERKTYSSRERLPESLPEYVFADRLKEQMKQKGITQAELAGMMNVSESTVKDWCQHYTFPSEMNLGELCRIFAPCSADYFHGTIEEPNYDVQFVMDYTGLSDTAVEYLHQLTAYSRQLGRNVKKLSNQMYREDFGQEPHPDFSDVLNVLFREESGFTQVLQNIIAAERMKSEYAEFNVPLPDDTPVEDVRTQSNKQELRELYFEKYKAVARELFNRFIESFLPPVR